jgi:hypothetical protein
MALAASSPSVSTCSGSVTAHGGLSRGVEKFARS